MNTLNFIIFLTLLNTLQVISSTPECQFYYKTLKINGNSFQPYACDVTINKMLSNPNELHFIHDEYSNKRNSDVKILTAAAESSKLNFKIFSSVYCNEFNNLWIIEMIEVDIEDILDGSFDRCLQLFEIKFQKNKINKIHENLFKNNLKLKELLISNNNINFLPENIFKSQKKLLILNLSQNKLKILNPKWFKSLQNLKELDLSSNRIEKLPENIFNPLMSLKSLKLHSNQISFIGAASFGQHPSLNELTVMNNQLFGIDEEFIRKIMIRKLNMLGNTCCDEEVVGRSQMDDKLEQCYENFKSTSVMNLESTESPTTKRTIKPTSTTRSTTRSTTSRSTTRRKPRVIPVTTTELPKTIESCGVRSSSIPLVINGQDFKPGTYPWMALLVTLNDEVHCGGILISHKKVLTAAHCIINQQKKYEANELHVVLGVHNLSMINEVHRTTEEIQGIHVHSDWNPSTIKYEADIAVVILKDEIKFNDFIKPICLPNNVSESITIGTIVGYGRTEDESKKFSVIPKEAETPIHNLKKCFKKFPNLEHFSGKTSFCAGHGNGTGACTGDSGGGLFVRHNNVFYVRGLVSLSIMNENNSCDVNVYSLYTNVSLYVSWIQNISEKDVGTRHSGIIWERSSNFNLSAGDDGDRFYWT